MHGLRVDLIEPGRVVCSMKVPASLLNAGNFLHGGATATLVDIVGSGVIYTVGAPNTGVSVEINISYLDAAYLDAVDGKLEKFMHDDWESRKEEIEIEGKVSRVGKAVGVTSGVEEESNW